MGSKPLPVRLRYLLRLMPGMNPREALVFNNWLILHDGSFDDFRFNVRVGNGSDPLPNLDPESARQWRLNSQKRIDVVAKKNSQTTLIEVKDRAGLSAIGQIIGYSHLWQLDNPISSPPSLLLVANRLDNDVFVVAQRSKIQVDVVEADFSLLRR